MERLRLIRDEVATLGHPGVVQQIDMIARLVRKRASGVLQTDSAVAAKLREAALQDEERVRAAAEAALAADDAAAHAKRAGKCKKPDSGS